MAKPQIENGHTKIANQLMEALARHNFSAYETRLLLVIFRKTYGWNKQADRISYSQFQEASGIDRRHIHRTITSLKNRGIITCAGTGYLLEYGIQKDYKLWDLTPKEAMNFDTDSGNELTPKEATIFSTDSGNELAPKEATIFSTNPGNELTPKEAIPDANNLTPIQGGLTPIQGESSPKEVSKSLPKEAHTKEIKHIQKHYTKATSKKETFEEFIQKKTIEYPELNILAEWEACKVWWGEGKKRMDRPKSALNNWLRIALEKKNKSGNTGGNHATNKRLTSRDLPTKYTTPEEWRQQIQQR